MSSAHNLLAAALLVTLVAQPAVAQDRPAGVELKAVRSALTFAPAAPRQGGRVTVTYTPMGSLAGERELLLRARFRAVGGDDAPAKYVVAAKLQRAPGGVFRASIQLPDSAVYAAFAVEDSSGQRVDANGGKRWELLVHGANGKPLYHSLVQSAHDHYGYWGLAYEANQRATQLYPDSIDGWSLLRFHENLALGAAGSDSLLPWHQKNFAALSRKYASQTNLPPKTIASLFSYGGRFADSATRVYWRTRLMAEASATREAAQQRGVATLSKWYRDKDTDAALNAFEKYWPEARGKRSQLPGWALQVAAASGDTVAIDRWVQRVQEEAGSGLYANSTDGIVYQIKTVPARRAQAIAMARSGVLRAQTYDPTARPLDRSVNAQQKVQANRLAYALGTFGRILADAGQLRAAIDTLERAASSSISPELFQLLGDLRLANGDTIGAAREYAVVAADPAAVPAKGDSLRAKLGFAAGDPRWRAQLDSAGERVLPIVLADTVRWSPRPSRVGDAAGKTHTLGELVQGKPTVLVFWATNCGPCVQEIPELVRLRKTLEPKGVRIITLTNDDRPGPQMQQFIESKGITYEVFYDLLHEASNAFGVTGIPANFVLDASGRVRFALSEASQIPRQIEALERISK